MSLQEATCVWTGISAHPGDAIMSGVVIVLKQEHCVGCDFKNIRLEVAYPGSASWEFPRRIRFFALGPIPFDLVVPVQLGFVVAGDEGFLRKFG